MTDSLTQPAHDMTGAVGEEACDLSDRAAFTHGSWEARENVSRKHVAVTVSRVRPKRLCAGKSWPHRLRLRGRSHGDKCRLGSSRCLNVRLSDFQSLDSPCELTRILWAQQ